MFVNGKIPPKIYMRICKAREKKINKAYHGKNKNVTHVNIFVWGTLPFPQGIFMQSWKGRWYVRSIFPSVEEMVKWMVCNQYFFRWQNWAISLRKSLRQLNIDIQWNPALRHPPTRHLLIIHKSFSIVSTFYVGYKTFSNTFIWMCLMCLKCTWTHRWHGGPCSSMHDDIPDSQFPV